MGKDYQTSFPNLQSNFQHIIVACVRLYCPLPVQCTGNVVDCEESKTGRY